MIVTESESAAKRFLKKMRDMGGDFPDPKDFPSLTHPDQLPPSTFMNYSDVSDEELQEYYEIWNGWEAYAHNIAGKTAAAAIAIDQEVANVYREVFLEYYNENEQHGDKHFRQLLKGHQEMIVESDPRLQEVKDLQVQVKQTHAVATANIKAYGRMAYSTAMERRDRRGFQWQNGT